MFGCRTTGLISLMASHVQGKSIELKLDANCSSGDFVIKQINFSDGLHTHHKDYYNINGCAIQSLRY